MACHKSMYQWQTMQETIDDLAGKISVKKRDNESIFRQGLETIKANEERIAALRSEVKELHQNLAKTMNMDYNVIQDALETRRETQLECKRYDAYTALKELNEDVCVEGKRLNHFIHQKECRMRRLQDLRLHYRDFLLLEQSNFEKGDQRRVRLLMTKLDKMIMKRNTASFLQSTYRTTLSKLNKDALTMHKHLDGLQQNNAIGKSEISELSKIYKSAKKGQEESRALRMSLEQDVYCGKQDRDKTIQETRKRAKQAADLPDFGAITRAPNDILNAGNSKTKKSSNKPSVELEKIKPIIAMFSAITNTLTAPDIPQAYKQQIEHFNAMSENCVKLEEKLKEKQQTVSSAKERLTEAKYHQAEKLKTLETEISKIQAEYSETTQTIEKNNEQKARLQRTLENVRDAIQGSVENLGLAGESNSSQLDIQIELISQKLDSISELLSKSMSQMNASQEDEGSEAPPEITKEQVQDALLRKKTKFCDSVRITVTNEDDASTADNFLMDDINLNEFYITRDDIKKYGSGAQKIKMKGKKR